MEDIDGVDPSRANGATSNGMGGAKKYELGDKDTDGGMKRSWREWTLDACLCICSIRGEGRGGMGSELMIISIMERWPGKGI